MRPSFLACLSRRSLFLTLAISLAIVPDLAMAQLLDSSTASSRSLRLLSGPEPTDARAEFPGSQPRRTQLEEVGTHFYLTYYGLTRGVIHGAMAAYAFPSDAKGYIGVMALVGGVGETVLANFLASNEEMTPGKAHVIGTAMDFGLLAGIGLDLATQVEFDWDNAERSKTAFMIPLALSVGGAIAGGLLVDARHLTWGDMEFVHMSGLVGALVGVAALATSDPSAGLGGLLGSGLGLLAGSYLVRERDFSLGQGLLLDLGAVVGGLGGTIAAAAAGSKAQPVAISAGLGAVLGLGITYALLSPSDQSLSPAAEAPVELSLQLDPGSFGSRDTRTGRPAPSSLMLQGRF